MTPLSELQQLVHPLFHQHNINVYLKRDDLIHPIISGNKWRKLKYNLTHVKQHNHLRGVLSFGGSYSNHIHALAFACHQQNLPCVGVIRGEASYANNYTLTWARHWGMKLHFVDRKTYRRRHDDDFLQQLQHQYPNYFIVPEGGSNTLAINGVSEVIAELTEQLEFDTLLTPVGSGGTIAGLIAGDYTLNTLQHKLLGIVVLKGAQYLKAEIEQLLPSDVDHKHWQLLHQYHRGGYAKFSALDIARIVEFNHITGVNFEPVYSGKMVLALLDLLDQGYFSAGERIVLLHTGGLQGLGGLIERGILTATQWSVPCLEGQKKTP